MFVFVIPPVTYAAPHERRNSAMTSAQPTLAAELRRNEARVVADGFQLMVNAQYEEAEFHFKRSIEHGARGAQKWNRTLLRMLAIASAIAHVQRFAPGAVMAPYYRGECPMFETTLDEQVAYRTKQNELRLPSNFVISEGGVDEDAKLVEVMERTHRGSGGVSHRKKLKTERRQKRNGARTTGGF